MTFIAMPVLVLDNLPDPAASDAVEAVAAPTTEATTTTAPTTTTVAPTTAPPTTEAPTTAPPTTAAPTTAPPTTARPRPTTTVAAPTTAPPTTAAPAPAPSASSTDVEATIRAVFGAAGDQAVNVARCESSLNPSASRTTPPEAGYYGLFQIGSSHAAAFQQVTGRDFWDAWDEAGPNSQYAKYLYDHSGWQPWGTCGQRASG